MFKTRIVAGIIAAMLAPAAANAELTGDPDSGAKIFEACTKCHQIGPGAKNKVGPVLNEVFGRTAGTADGFKRYSKNMKRMGKDGLVWDHEHLNIFLENPKSLISGTRMSFPGVKDPQQRADVISYLRTFSANPQNIPESAPTTVAAEVTLPPEVLALVGDPEFGEYLAAECNTCHQADGSDKGIPSITGWPEEDFVVAMHSYKVKLRPHPVMQMMAGRLADEEIAALAAYYAKLGAK